MIRIVLAVVVLTVLVATPAMCLQADGSPWDTTSWAQTFTDDWGNITGGTVVAHNYVIAPWAGHLGIVPALQSLPAPPKPTGFGPISSWLSTNGQEYRLWAAGAVSTTHSEPAWTWTFTGTKSQQKFVVRYAALNASGAVLGADSGLFGWNGSSWSHVGGWDGPGKLDLGAPPESTPELGTWMLLACTGLVGLVPLSRRRRK